MIIYRMVITTSSKDIELYPLYNMFNKKPILP